MKNFIYSLVTMLVMLFTCVSLSSCGNDNKPKTAAVDESSEDVGDILSQTELFDGYVVFQSSVVPLGETASQVRAGLKKDGKVIIEPRFANIEYDAALDGFKCYADAQLYTVANMDGKVLREGAYERVDREEDGAIYRFFNKDKMAVYSTKAQTSWGMYEKIVVTKHFVFVKEGNLWGVKSIDGVYEFDKIYNKVYVVNYKSEKKFDVVTCENGKWELCDQDKAYYSDASEAEIKRLIKAPVAEPVGELDYAKF